MAELRLQMWYIVYGKASAMKRKENPEREIAVIMTDIRKYAKLTSHMTAEQIRDFIIDYQTFLQKIVIKGKNGASKFEPFAGDASISVFENRAGEDGKEKCRRALKVAVRIAEAVECRHIPYTRVGIFAGNIIEAPFEKLTLRFGNTFSAASRLEELCAYFGTTVLMDRNIALAQDEEQKYIVSIGKITPKNFSHAIHVCSIYKPGIHGCPLDINEAQLMEYIRLKNKGIERFMGNDQKGVLSNFPAAGRILIQAANIFKEATGGAVDVATLRILEYIRENPSPADTFQRQGMVIDEKQGGSPGIRLLRLSQELLKALDQESYSTLVEDTNWEDYFKVEWISKGDTIIHAGDEPNGIYYLVKGEVQVEDVHGSRLAQLSEGDIFGEMAYFSKDKKRNATIVAITDIVVRKISTEDFEKLPVLQKLFAAIAERRSTQV